MSNRGGCDALKFSLLSTAKTLLVEEMANPLFVPGVLTHPWTAAVTSTAMKPFTGLTMIPVAVAIGVVNNPPTVGTLYVTPGHDPEVTSHQFCPVLMVLTSNVACVVRLSTNKIRVAF
jgi:hypothetical protein